MPTLEHIKHEIALYWQRSSIRRIVTGIAAVVGVFIFGVGGYVANGWTAFDGLFMVAITISGVGFGEVNPLTTSGLRWHTMLVIAAGLVSVGYTLAGFLQFLTEGELQRLLGHSRMRRQIDLLDGHIVVAGFGRVGSLVCEELKKADVPFVIVELASERTAEIEALGFLYVQGDATEEKMLHEAGLERAASLVTVMPSDAQNVFITLTARQMAPNVRIIARAEQPSTQRKLVQAGANHVVLPAAIGAHRIASLLTNPSAVEFAELVTQRSTLAIEMDELPVRHRSALEGLTLREADIGRRTGVMVVAIKHHDGRVEFPPSGDEPLQQGDSLVLLGGHENLQRLRHNYGV